MSWGSTIAIGILTAIAGAGAAGWVAALCVDWYRISSREGESGFFIAGIGALGLFAGLVAGLITAPIVASGFWQALGSALAIVLGLCGVVAFFARMNG